MGTGWSQTCCVVVVVVVSLLLFSPSAPSAWDLASADMRTVAQEGAVTTALYVSLLAGPSWQGRRVRAWMAWHWVNM